MLFVGSPGTGKTHLAAAIGTETARHRYSVYFKTCQELMNQLKKAELENRLLIIDEIGYLNLDSEDANLFFQLISLRYEKKSTVITTNKSLSKWNEIFGDPVITNAILDRLLHHSHIVNIVGRSLRNQRKRNIKPPKLGNFKLPILRKIILPLLTITAQSPDVTRRRQSRLLLRQTPTTFTKRHCMMILHWRLLTRYPAFCRNSGSSGTMQRSCDRQRKPQRTQRPRRKVRRRKQRTHSKKPFSTSSIIAGRFCC
nr:ATP-binding protein [Sharpea azabuensis]